MIGKTTARPGRTVGARADVGLLLVVLTGVCGLLFAAAASAQEKKKPDPTPAITTYLPLPLELPKADEMFQIETEAMLQARIRREAAKQQEPPIPVPFPEEQQRKEVAIPLPDNDQITQSIEPAFLCYRPLLFEQKVFERCAWDLGPITPLASGLLFYADVIKLPWSLGCALFDHCECTSDYHQPSCVGPCVIPDNHIHASESTPR